MEKIYAHRNLNEAKRDWSIWWYTVGKVKGNVGRGLVDGHTQNITIENVTANCQQAALKAIYDGGYRSVSAWLIGYEVENAGDAEGGRRFSINPKLGDTCFKWSDTGEDVIFPLDRVDMRPDGTYSI